MRKRMKKKMIPKEFLKVYRFESVCPPTPTPDRPQSPVLRVSRRLLLAVCPGSLWSAPASPKLRRSRPRQVQKQARRGAGPFPGSPSDWKGIETESGQSAVSRDTAGQPGAANPPRAGNAWGAPGGIAVQTALLRPPAPAASQGHRAGSQVEFGHLWPAGGARAGAGDNEKDSGAREELMTTPILQATAALSPQAEASTALIAVVITVIFLTLLSVVVLIFFYLYKNKGSYVTYEPAGGEPSAILQMESDSAKEEYFI
ncbi:PREDICTED: uncharacterized protein LOC102857236 [Elephantulus edwardii]|uniref:uncharacterized protein LOC102857236 n=1 Tax=Elephantulus edwardii TaxID=28737 RepID=UPI0003F05CBB|nr:PREDICTED: uncharacterized protein LOC102857236 [Elephantulus edwardii]